MKFVVHSVIEKAALSRSHQGSASRTGTFRKELQESEERYRLWGVRTLRESEERCRLLIEGVLGYAIIMLDPKGLVILWNTGAEKIYGYRAEEIIGRHFSCFYSISESNEAYPEHELLEVSATTGHYVNDDWEFAKTALTSGSRQSDAPAKRIRRSTRLRSDHSCHQRAKKYWKQ